MFISLNCLGSLVLDVNGNTGCPVPEQYGRRPWIICSIVKVSSGPQVTVAATDATATEAGITTGTFTVTRTGGPRRPDRATTPRAAAATAGSDYTALTGSCYHPRRRRQRHHHRDARQ